MLVGEIIEMTKDKPVATIARDHLTIGEKRLRDTLKEIGGHHQKGQKGWTFQGKSEDLERSIYDFVQTNKKEKAAAEQINKNSNEQKNKISGETKNKNSGETINENPGEQKKEITKKRASFDIDLESLKKIKIYAIEVDQKISDVVDEALYLYINQKNL